MNCLRTPVLHFEDINGRPLVGGALYVYEAGTDTPAQTYSDPEGTTFQTFPIMLNQRGECRVFAETGRLYKMVLKDSLDTVVWEADNVYPEGSGEGVSGIAIEGVSGEISVSVTSVGGILKYTIGLANEVKNTITNILGLVMSAWSAINRKEESSNKISVWGNSPDNTQYPGAKLVKDTIDNLPPGTAVKGDAESEYRTGNVNLTPANIGAEPAITTLSVSKGGTGAGTAAGARDNLDVYSKSETDSLMNGKVVIVAELPDTGEEGKTYYVGPSGSGADKYEEYIWDAANSQFINVGERSIDLSNYLQKDGDGKDVIVTFSQADTRANLTNGEKLSVMFGKIMKWFADLGTAAFKTLVTSWSSTTSDSNIPSEKLVKDSLDGKEPAFSVLPINKGGTGKTNEKAALNQLTSQMTHYDTQPTDDTLLVQKFGTPTDTNGALYTRPYSYLWAYIKSKISSVLGLSENGYTGNAATATSATTAAGYTNDGAIATALAGKYVKPSGGIPKTDLASDVQTSLGKADSALQAHQSVTDNNPTLAWSTTSKVGSVGSTDLRVTMPANPAQDLSSFKYESIGSTAVNLNDLLYAGECHAYVWTYANRANVANKPSGDGGVVLSFSFYSTTYGIQIAMDGNDYEKPLYIRFKAANQWGNWIPFRDASWINSGTFGTARIADDAITADKVKDNETLPVSISGNAATSTHFGTWGEWFTWYADAYNPSKPYVRIAECTINLVGNDGAGEMFQLEFGNGDIARFRLDFRTSGSTVSRSNIVVLESTWTKSGLNNRLYVTYFKYDNDSKLAIRIYVRFYSLLECFRIRQFDAQTGDYGHINWRAATLYNGNGSYTDTPTGTRATTVYNLVHTNNAAVGNSTTPVYVDSDGQVQACDPSQMNVGSASNAQSHSTLETQVNKGLAAYKETYTNVTLIQGDIYSQTIALEVGQENSSGNGIRLLLNNNSGNFSVSIRQGPWNSWMAGGDVIWMLEASYGVGVQSPVTKINNDTKTLANLTVQTIGAVDIGGTPGQYPINGTIRGRFYFVSINSSGLLTFEASFSTSQSTQYGGYNDTFVIGKAEWTSFADHKVTSSAT